MAHKTIFFLWFIPAGLLLAGCSLGDHQLEECWWKYGEGHHVGDVIDFKAGYTLRQDTLFRGGHEVAVVGRITKGFWRKGNQMVIHSLDGKQSGVYHQQ